MNLGGAPGGSQALPGDRSERLSRARRCKKSGALQPEDRKWLSQVAG